MEPTAKELDLIENLKIRIQDLEMTNEQLENYNIVKWIRARDDDLDKAEDMIRKSLAWRKENEIDSILSWTPPEHLVKNYPFYILGHDEKTGNPVNFVPFGRWNIAKLISNGERDVYIKYNDQINERLAELMRQKSKEGRPVTQLIMIFDMEGFSLKQITTMGCVDAMLSTVRRLEDNYPEVLAKAYGINAPRIFAILFALIKPLLTARTLSKVEIHGSNANKWKASLAKSISTSLLPPKLGGTNSKVEIFQSNEINGGEIGEESHSGLIPVSVEAGEKLKIIYDITKPGTTLSYQFKTDDFDIGFSIIYGNEEEIVKYERFSSHVETQKGTITCNGVGKYTLIFDNEYSRMRAKNIYYEVNLTHDGVEVDDEVTAL